MENEKRINIHQEICKELHSLYLTKNANYGNSFSNTRKVVKNAIIVRLMDKIERLKTLLNGEEDLVGESIEDTLTDLANYAILELIERKMEKEIKTAGYVLTYTEETNDLKYEYCENIKKVESFIFDKYYDTTKAFEIVSITRE